MSKKRIGLGKRGEDAAASFLVKQGYRIISRNYRQKCGEIDIICRDGGCYVFVEVKTRQDSGFGTPAEAVTIHKQRKISLTAQAYLNRNNLHDVPVRFDVIGVMLAAEKAEITHIIAAFDTVWTRC